MHYGKLEVTAMNMHSIQIMECNIAFVLTLTRVFGKNQIYEDYSMLKARIRELETVLKNIDAMLHEQSKEPEQKQEQNRAERS